MPNYDTYNYYNSDDDINDYYNNIYMNIENYIYHPEEESNTKYNLINYEIYNPYIHGKAEKSIFGQLLVCDRYKYVDNDSIENIIYECENINMAVCERINTMPTCIHPFIRNFKNITMTTSGKLEIAECIYLHDGTIVAILKTFWLKLIQRKWKNIFKERSRIQKLRMRVASFVHREIHGEWPEECRIMPCLRGMLNNLYYECPNM
jgi:hypothetical protein